MQGYKLSETILASSEYTTELSIGQIKSERVVGIGPAAEDTK